MRLLLFTLCKWSHALNREKTSSADFLVPRVQAVVFFPSYSTDERKFVGERDCSQSTRIPFLKLRGSFRIINLSVHRSIPFSSFRYQTSVRKAIDSVQRSKNRQRASQLFHSAIGARTLAAEPIWDQRAMQTGAPFQGQVQLRKT